MTQKYEIGSQWETRGGWRAVVVEHFPDGGFLAYHTGCGLNAHEESGKSKHSAHIKFDLIRPWVEKRSGWVNIRCDDPLKPYAVFHETKEDADAAADDGITKRLACVKWKEGDGI